MQRTWEVEQKYVLHSAEALRCRLNELGFELAATEEHADCYFRHPCRDFRETGEAFRLRRINDQACVTYKGSRLGGPVKIRPEIELGIYAEDAEQWNVLLTQLGFVPLPEILKTRSVYRPLDSWSGCPFTVVIDQVESIGLFAEVELLVHDKEELQTAQAQITEFSKQLPLSEIQTHSYLSMHLKRLGMV